MIIRERETEISNTTSCPSDFTESKKFYRTKKEPIQSRRRENEPRQSHYTGRWTTSVGGAVEAETEEEMEEQLVNMRGRSWASESSMSSEVERLMQEQRSSDAKKAVATLVPTHDAMIDKHPL
ncbi:hypothetical protein SLE2022_374360 [Rubroshorea leprosula]